MKTTPAVVTGFAVGFIVACMTVSGCSEEASRMLNVYQPQSTETYEGPFLINTSELPRDAIKTHTETGGPGKPETKMELNSNYEFEIVLRLLNADETGKTPSTSAE